MSKPWHRGHVTKFCPEVGMIPWLRGDVSGLAPGVVTKFCPEVGMIPWLRVILVTRRPPRARGAVLIGTPIRQIPISYPINDIILDSRHPTHFSSAYIWTFAPFSCIMSWMSGTYWVQGLYGMVWYGMVMPVWSLQRYKTPFSYNIKNKKIKNRQKDDIAVK